jgi:hypothetical protein
MSTKNIKQEKKSFSMNEDEFKNSLKKIFQSPPTKVSNKKKARPAKSRSL